MGLVGLSFLGVLLSFAVQLSISRHFGTSVALDGYLLAYTIALFTTFCVGPIRGTVGPQFFKRLGENPREAEAFLQPIMGWMAIALALSTLAALGVGHALRSGWLPVAGGLRPYVSDALLWLTPAIFLIAISEVLNTLFACYNRPVLQQAVRLIAPCSMIVAVTLAANVWGVRARLWSCRRPACDGCSAVVAARTDGFAGKVRMASAAGRKLRRHGERAVRQLFCRSSVRDCRAARTLRLRGRAAISLQLWCCGDECHHHHARVDHRKRRISDVARSSRT
jgi:hypothetical protein